jgi:acyl carrier protein
MNAELKTLEIVSDVLEDTQVTGATSRQNTPEWNSLKHMEIIFAIEETFGIQYSEEEMVDIDSVVDIVKSIEEKIHET